MKKLGQHSNQNKVISFRVALMICPSSWLNECLLCLLLSCFVAEWKKKRFGLLWLRFDFVKLQFDSDLLLFFTPLAFYLSKRLVCARLLRLSWCRECHGSFSSRINRCEHRRASDITTWFCWKLRTKTTHPDHFLCKTHPYIENVFDIIFLSQNNWRDELHAVFNLLQLQIIVQNGPKSQFSRQLI